MYTKQSNDPVCHTASVETSAIQPPCQHKEDCRVPRANFWSVVRASVQHRGQTTCIQCWNVGQLAMSKDETNKSAAHRGGRPDQPTVFIRGVTRRPHSPWALGTTLP